MRPWAAIAAGATASLALMLFDCGSERGMRTVLRDARLAITFGYYGVSKKVLAHGNP